MKLIMRLGLLTSGLLIGGTGCDSADGPTSPSGPVAALSVASVSPATGSSAGGTNVSIAGTGFVPGATVSIGDVVVPSTVRSAAHITATTRGHELGTVDVVVANPGGQASRIERAFTFVVAAVRLSVGGDTTLEAVGQTSQLTVVAEFSDGTSRDVTAEARWSSDRPDVGTISPEGLLTSTGLGNATVTASFPRTGLTIHERTLVTVTPPGTFTASGRVRHPGEGNVDGARVLHPATGQSALTSRDGGYSLGGLTDGRLIISKDRYEPVELMATPDGMDDIPLQLVVQVEAGSSPITGTLAPNDVEYLVAPGTFCQPCRLIWINSETTDIVRVRVGLTEQSTDLNVWSNGQQFRPTTSREITASLPITGGTPLAIYVGSLRSSAPGGYKPFTLSVSPGG